MSRTIVLCLMLGVVPLVQTPAVDIGPPPGTLVDVGGRKIHIHCSGTGAPTIVLEAGASAFAIDFSLVQPDIARTNRVCSYDRAGHGWSDPNPAANDSTVVADLHAALQASGEKPPYVLVGASRGGLYVRLYQIRYPDEVAGLVLVDPAHEDRLFTMFEGQGVAIASLTAEQLRSTIRPGPVRVPRRSAQTGTPFDKLPGNLYATRLALERRLIAAIPESVSYDDRLQWSESERASLALLHQHATATSHPLGDRPVIVLTRGVDASQEMKDVQGSVARQSTNARHTVVAGAGHEIHLFEPRVVIQAIRDVVEASRSKRALPTRIGQAGRSVGDFGIW